MKRFWLRVLNRLGIAHKEKLDDLYIALIQQLNDRDQRILRLRKAVGHLAAKAGETNTVNPWITVSVFETDEVQSDIPIYNPMIGVEK